MEKARKKSSLYVYFPAMLINIGALMSGCAASWSSSAASKLNGQKPDENPLSEPVTETEMSFIASLITIGLIFGPSLAPSVDKIGRKKCVLIASAFHFLCLLLIAFTRTVWLLFFARLLFGIINGWMIVVIPIFVTEIAEKNNRGNVNLLKVNISLGMLLMYCIGPYTSIFLSSIICLVPLVLVTILIVVFVPESPYYLVRKGDKAGAELALVKLRRHKDVGKELEEIIVNVEGSFKGKGNMLEIFQNSSLFKCMLIGFGLITFQQLNGSTPVLFYLQTIFESSGGNLSPEISSIIVGFIQFISSIFSPMLVDRLGRRFLLLFSSAGTFLCLICLGIYFHLKSTDFPTENINWLPITSLVIFFICYSVGFGSVPYTIISEIFPQDFKALACSLSIGWLGVSSFVLSISFPFMLNSIGIVASFWTFAGFSLVGVAFIYFCVPETKHKSFLEIQKMLKILKD